MLSDNRITELKNKLLKQKEELNFEGDRYNTKMESLTETVDELSSYDNHPADLGTELYEREKEQALDNHAASQIGKIDAALEAIENGSYGSCKVCGIEIPYERLEVVPSTLYCVEHTPDSNRVSPEKETLERPATKTFEMNKDPQINDDQDSFKEVARYGTSETPSDFVNVPEDFDELYEDQKKNDNFTEVIETFAGTDIEGKNKQIYPNEKSKAYKKELDEEGIESPLGNIPAKKRDSYIDDKTEKK